jgi:hypothetical protein
VAEGGRPSERGHLKLGCLFGLVLLPLVLMRALLADYVEVGGLFPTPVRRALLEAIAEGHGRIYFEAGHAWDHAIGCKVTDKVRQMLGAEWIRAEKVDHSTKRPGELAGRTYYRVLPAGESILSKGKQR